MDIETGGIGVCLILSTFMSGNGSNMAYPYLYPTFSGRLSSVHSMNSWVLWIANTSLMPTSYIHRVLVRHFLVFLVGIDTKEWAGSSILLIVLKWVIFVTRCVESISTFVPWGKNIQPL